MPAAEYPVKIALSSAKAIVLAASFAGCQSESLAPRSTSSIICLSSSNGTHSSTSGFTSRCRAMMSSPGADGRQRYTARAVQVDDAATCEIAFEGTGCLLLDLRPRRVGDRSKLAVQVVHDRGFPLSEPIPREPSGTGGTGCGGSTAGDAAAGSGGALCVTSSRNVAVGTKKRLPVTARLKSRMRS